MKLERFIEMCDGTGKKERKRKGKRKGKDKMDEGSGKYPELDKIAKKLAKDVGNQINKSVTSVKSEMPYKAQYVLEELIGILKKAV